MGWIAIKISLDLLVPYSLKCDKSALNFFTSAITVVLIILLYD